MCTVLLPPGVNPIAVDKYIDINKIVNVATLDSIIQVVFFIPSVAVLHLPKVTTSQCVSAVGVVARCS